MEPREPPATGEDASDWRLLALISGYLKGPKMKTKTFKLSFLVMALFAITQWLADAAIGPNRLRK
jgi:hypothetical protein